MPENGEVAPTLPTTTKDMQALMKTWWVGMDLEYKGVDLGEVLTYDLYQILLSKAGLR